ncbi:hypothetical protein NM688_g4228 [Phlebia brevispora]|uniref:Uncharacterized protein n=1 Tax=Phlebia brevispora TaxID=194682 RepID=A0ACC1T3X4_9APHY|nr:hypothetical protein NM688_g4228 [Phlebia brevispora]
MSTTGYLPTSSESDIRKKSDVELKISEPGEDGGVKDGELQKSAKGFRFGMIFLAICVSMFMSALEFTSVGTALPTIIHDLQGQDFVWIGSAYALASTALLPASGGMAEIFGRRITMLISLALFALGSALCGSAKNMNWLIAARTIQGAGGGGILALGSIVISDLVPLKERGSYNGIIGLMWAFASGMGPIVGGALAERGQWRWLFYLNLPITGFAAVLVFVFMRLPTPRGSFRDKIRRMDWIGNVIIIASSTACVIGLTWGGVKFAWSSAQVLAPLIIGLVGIAGFLVYEAKIASEPVVPFTLLSNRTTLSGYLQTFINPIAVMAVIYFLPSYFQACKGASPIRSGVDIFGFSIPVGPALVIAGASVQITKKYRVQLWFGWVLVILAAGTMSTIKADTALANTVGYTVLHGVGMGIIYATTYFPVLAPLPVSENAHALAFFSFCRAFALVWGVTIGTAVLQTQLGHRLPAEFLSQFPEGVAIAYSIIPVIKTLEDPLRTQVRDAFADSIAVIWKVNIGIAGMGLLSSLAMKSLPLHTEVDKRWGLDGEHHEITEVPVDTSVLPSMT